MPEMHPDPRGFLPRYLLALFPLIVVALSLVISAVLSVYLEGFSGALNGPLRNMLSGMDELMQVSVLLAAPVGVYLTFVAIGWMARITQVWTGSALALGISGLWGLLLVTFSPDPTLNPLLDFLYWVAYLILPASIAAALVLVAWAEKLRRSIRYRLTGEGIVTTGGVWKRQESLLPYPAIGSLVLEQDPLGRIFHTGTIIPVGPAFGGPRAAGGKGDSGAGRDASRHPLDCLFGIRDPEKVMGLLEQLISLTRESEEEQVPTTGSSRGTGDPRSQRGKAQ